jgi:alpha-glucosidase
MTPLEPHHDGSDLYVLDAPAGLGDVATVRIRVPDSLEVERVVLRHVRDGEPRGVLAEVDERALGETWYRAAFPVWNPATRYRFVLSGGRLGYASLNAAGLAPHDVPDGDDFVIAPGADGPAWHLSSVVYEIFPDRFAPDGRPAEPPEWAVPRGWDDRPTGRGRQTPYEWFGGQLRGIEEHLDHVERLGANVLYLTPVFPAGSTHRYDASTFGTVDPLLGGDEALASLVRAAHARGLRVVGDLTLNHAGVGHEWFAAARASADAPERGFFLFREDGSYESWLGVRSLPKLDHRDPELGRRLVDGEDAVARRWLRPPFSLDGWRIDVANMVGRFHDVDLAHDVARRMRAAVARENPQALLVAEHGYDARDDLAGDGWHGTMNYAGFLRPVWSWLRGETIPDELRQSFWGLPVGLPSLPGPAVVATMRRFRGGAPWSSTLHSWALLDSHDTARFRTVAGSRTRQLVGIGMQMTTPGVPMVFAGDELGLEGDWGEDARRTMPWSRPETWDGSLLDAYRDLVALRRSSEALARGGLRYVHVGDEAIAYLRETRAERLLCLASRAPHDPISVPFTALETLYGDDAADGVLPADGPAFHVWRISNG